MTQRISADVGSWRIAVVLANQARVGFQGLSGPISVRSSGARVDIEVRQAIGQVCLVIEQHGISRFEPLDYPAVKPVSNRLGWRKGSGTKRKSMIPSEKLRAEICAGLDAKMVARTLVERGMLERAGDGFQPVRKITGTSKRVY